ncbi:MAG TPA: hypothetical protein VHR46_04900 [Gaiella sp.]|nr:hypothetical protein [Gaiella sp.]
MHVDRLHRRIGLGRILWVAAVLALFGGSSTAVAARASSSPQLAGTWSGKYGGAYSGTFTLHWRQTGTKLTGSIRLSKPSGTYPISGSVQHSAIRFGAVGVGATYTGSVSGTSMSGRYKTPQGGGPWSAHKTS